MGKESQIYQSLKESMKIMKRQKDMLILWGDPYIDSSKINVCCLTGRQNQSKYKKKIIILANPIDDQDAATIM